MKVVERCARPRSAEVDDMFYTAGDTVDDVFVVNSGRVGIVERSLRGERVVRIQGLRRLLGELGMVEGQPALCTARVVDAREILALPVQRLEEVALPSGV